ncbi:hypothetical protein B0A49_04041 [Cryomyces minteri]|uniref:N-acetyltransferase domain-containing protein n=1 Tax=Cryomyces minteri TaxID=331657 RepID=A0A4U0WWH7_9PEZI|nr:hypothetical protein B0A49_04041 [Cryomyces minteri]
MPRDLQAETSELAGPMESMAPLSKVSAREAPSGDPTLEEHEAEDGRRPAEDDSPSADRGRLDAFYTVPLLLSDVDACVKLEEAAFPINERCTRDKFMYRLTMCNELSLGLFTSATPDCEAMSAETAAVAHPAYSGSPERKRVLLAHLVCTKSTHTTVRDQDMDYPKDWRAEPSAKPYLGHKESGRTVCVHSLAVLPGYQGRGYGSALMKSFVQRIETSGVADRIALLTYDRLVPFYEKLGFKNLGKSEATFGGVAWSDMVYEFTGDALSSN